MAIATLAPAVLAILLGKSDHAGVAGPTVVQALFVVLREGNVLDAALAERIRQRIREKASGRHVPDAIVLVDDIRRTLSVKKVEVPARRLLLGSDPAQVASTAAIQHLGSLEFSFVTQSHWVVLHITSLV